MTIFEVWLRRGEDILDRHEFGSDKHPNPEASAELWAREHEEIHSDTSIEILLSYVSAKGFIIVYSAHRAFAKEREGYILWYWVVEGVL